MTEIFGILNATPDSFYAGSRRQTEREIRERAAQIVGEGGSVIDVGAYSTRPGAEAVAESEELRRMRAALEAVRRECPEARLSVDTFRPTVARMAVEEYGATIINDISEGGRATDALTVDGPAAATPAIWTAAAELHCTYILMSTRPTVAATIEAFRSETAVLRSLGVGKLILDPGFGFGKSLDSNYRHLAALPEIAALGLPVMAALSRKSMIWRLLGTDADGALAGTTALHAAALLAGATALRVHDVREAADTVRVIDRLKAGAADTPQPE